MRFLIFIVVLCFVREFKNMIACINIPKKKLLGIFFNMFSSVDRF